MNVQNGNEEPLKNCKFGIEKGQAFKTVAHKHKTQFEIGIGS